MGSCLNLLFSILTDAISGFRQLQPTVSFDGELSESSVFYFDGYNEWFRQSQPTVFFDEELSESSVFYFDGCNDWFSVIAADTLALLGGNGSCFSA